MILSPPPKRMRCVGYEHLHIHSDFSLLDGFGQVEEYAAHWKQFGKYLCVSDHGMLGVIPRQIKTCDEHKLSPIFACELYVQPLHRGFDTKEELRKYIDELSPEDAKEMRKSYHLLAIAYNAAGYQNLVQLSSWGWTKGFYYKPRVNHEQLLAHRDGLIFTSCCYNSEVGQAFDRGGEDAAYQMIERYMKMFPGRYVLEMMLLDFAKQKPYDAFIVKAIEKYKLPAIITNDCHYCLKEDSHYQRIMLMIQTGRTLQDIQDAIASDSTKDLFELQDSNLYMKSEEELNEKWESDYSDIIPLEVFEKAKENTVKICEKAKGVKLDRSIKLPEVPDADLKLWDKSLRGFKWRGLPVNKKYTSRLREEYELICRKGFSSYFLIQQRMTDEARRVAPQFGYNPADVISPGRGSGVGALTCYCLGITDVDPIEDDLLFSRFLSEARGGKQMSLRFKNIDPIPEGA